MLFEFIGWLFTGSATSLLETLRRLERKIDNMKTQLDRVGNGSAPPNAPPTMGDGTLVM